MQSSGYWFKYGKLYEVGHAHIDLIVAYPEKFKMTKEYVQGVFESFGEKIGSEGKAREVLIKEALNSGWIRIRHYNKPRDYWSIQYDNWNDRKASLRTCVEDLILIEKTMGMNDEVIFLGMNDNSRYHYSFMDGGIEKFVKEVNVMESKKINVQKIIDFRDM